MRVHLSLVCTVAVVFVGPLVGCLPGGGPVAADGGNGEEQAEEQVSFTNVQIGAGEPHAVALNNAQVILRTEAGLERAVPVVLEHSIRPYSVDFTWEGTAYHREGVVQVYQLRSLDLGAPHEWAMVYHGEPLDQLKLAALGLDRNYLAWVRGPSVLFVEVSTPRGIRASLMERFSGQVSSPVYQVLPRDIVGDQPFGVDAVKSDLHLVSLDLSEADEFRLRVHGTDPDQVFTLVSPDGSTWQRE